MSKPDSLVARIQHNGVLLLIFRLVVGGMFIYTGINKVLDPVGFHKMIVQYNMVPTHPPYLLNSLAALLPWLEIWWGLLLILGIGLRGTALVVLLMLVGFTVSIFLRAFVIYQTTEVASFCSIAFDCGCGTGVQKVCHKLPENILLCLMCVALVASRTRRFCLRRDLIRAGA